MSEEKQQPIQDIFQEIPENQLKKTEKSSQNIDFNSGFPTKEKNKGKLLLILVIIFIILFVLLIFTYWQQQKNPVLVSEQQEPLIEDKILESNATSTPAEIIKPKIIILDQDHDGLTDEEEKKFGTDKSKADTDLDGLYDKEELKVYFTNPLNSDTDGDGIIDGEEVKKGTNPKDKNPEAKIFNLQKEIDKLK